MSFNALHHLVNNWGMGVEDQIPENWFKELDRKDLKVLEVGFGKGSLLRKLSRPEGPELYGIECSQQNYRYVTTGNNKIKASLSLSDISMERFQYPDGLFDYVVMLEVLEHIMSPMHAILEIQRVLKKDQIFIFSWPEERMISGIGIEENQKNRRHDAGFHSFPYPGLFRYDNMRVFFNQLYFKIIDEVKKDYHIFFKMINVKPDRPHILDIVNGDYSKTLFDDIETVPKFKELIPCQI